MTLQMASLVAAVVLVHLTVRDLGRRGGEHLGPRARVPSEPDRLPVPVSRWEDVDMLGDWQRLAGVTRWLRRVAVVIAICVVLVVVGDHTLRAVGWTYLALSLVALALLAGSGLSSATPDDCRPSPPSDVGACPGVRLTPSAGSVTGPPP